MVLSYISMTVLMITGILMIIIILLQRGRGGGLAGAFGGLGGQSAFGTKAGDVFTKITVGLAVFWVVLAGLSGLALERDSNRRYIPDATEETVSSPDKEKEKDVRESDGLPKFDESIDDKTKSLDDKKAEKEPIDGKASKTPPPLTVPTNPNAGSEKSGAETKSAPKADADAAKTPAPAPEKKPADGADAGKTSEEPAKK